MDQEIRKQWTAALRSGEYSQSTQYLRTNNGFCCLGVLCDLYDKTEKPKIGWETNIDQEFSFGAQRDDQTLPTEIQAWSKLMTSNPGFQTFKAAYGSVPKDDLGRIYPNEILCLAEANDDGLTFPQIADIIDYFFKD